MKLSEEEFDQNYYTYGLELYENIPLIEPLEYSEEKRIRDFVIAIDTSGSVQGEKVQSFMQHTYDILRAEDTFFSRVNIRILQCDDRIREDVLITNEEEFEAYLRQMELKGFGRTDFRPVFSYVEELMRKKELVRLQGLLYFTDGDGIYPERTPSYDTAFLLNGEDADEALVPHWAMSLILEEEELER